MNKVLKAKMAHPRRAARLAREGNYETAYLCLLEWLGDEYPQLFNDENGLQEAVNEALARLKR